ncbi:MAG: DUF1778 domain-containing protein [Gammaproteobacteria bacterium]
MNNPQTRTAPINLRALPAQKALLDRAAAARGKNRTEFVLEAACAAAENVLLDQCLFRLDARAWRAFERALEAPVKKNPALRRLLAEPAPWER